MGCYSSKAVSIDIPPQIGFFDKYELGDVLGRGAYGTVHIAHRVKSHEKLAVKILDLQGGSVHPIGAMLGNSREDVGAERTALTRIGNHPNVVGFRESFNDGSFAYFVMEYCTGCLLTAWMTEPHLNEYTYARCFRDMAHALAHIHLAGIVHRDVKQVNFMVGAPDGRTVKLCDFGLSAEHSGDGSLSGHFGTAPYMAPEMLRSKGKHGPPADVWSLGVIVYNAFFGCWPYESKVRTVAEMKRVIREGTNLPSFAPPWNLRPNVVSEPGIRFVKGLLDRNPATRPSAASCLEMDYLNPRPCNNPLVNGVSARMISLSPQLHAARKCGAFLSREPKADAFQERHLMKLQYNAQLKRESCPSSANGTSTSTTATSNASGANSMPHQPC